MDKIVLMIHRRHRKIIHQRHDQEIPYSIRLFAWSRAVRWIGWGLGEALLPVFILLFSKTFAEMGLMSSTVDIASLVSLPLIGVWADRMSAKKMVLISLLLYPLVGVSYFLAGAWGMAIFVVVARVVNGFTWELENIGVDTYYRRIADSRHIAASFGFMEVWSHVAWIGAALIGMGLVLFMPIHWLLLGIAPFALIACLFVIKAPADDIKTAVTPKLSVMRTYAKAMNEWRTWDTNLWLLGVLIMFSSIFSALMYFFIPIDAYIDGANLPMVVLITVFGAIPALFSYGLGRKADARDPNSLIILGLVGVAAVGTGLALVPLYWFKLLAMFAAGIILELFYVVESRLITILGPSETYGERGSAFESIIVVGDLVAPLILGVAFDVLGFSTVSIIVAACGVVLGLVYRIAGMKSAHTLAAES